MEATITISEKVAKSLYKKASPRDRKVLDSLMSKKQSKPSKDIYQAKSFEDLCKIEGVKPSSVLPYKKPKNIFQHGVNSFAKLALIRDTFCKGWEANWDDSDEKKWYPYFYMGAGFGFAYTYYGYDCSRTDSGSRLCFPDSTMAEHVGRTFSNEYKDFLNK